MTNMPETLGVLLAGGSRAYTPCATVLLKPHGWHTSKWGPCDRRYFMHMKQQHCQGQQQHQQQ
jgi:hypothetical protein